MILLCLTGIFIIYEMLVLLVPAKVKEFLAQEKLLKVMSDFHKKAKKDGNKEYEKANLTVGALVLKNILPHLMLLIIYWIYLIILMFSWSTVFYALTILAIGQMKSKMSTGLKMKSWFIRLDNIITTAILVKIFMVLLGEIQ